VVSYSMKSSQKVNSVRKTLLCSLIKFLLASTIAIKIISFIEILNQKTSFLKQIKNLIKLKLLILVHLYKLRMARNLMRNSEHHTILLQRSFKRIMELNVIYGLLESSHILFCLVFHHLMVRLIKRLWKKLSSENSISTIQSGNLFLINAKISFQHFLLSIKMLDHQLKKLLNTLG